MRSSTYSITSLTFRTGCKHFLGKSLDSAQALLDAITLFVREQVAPDRDRFDLRNLLSLRQEVTVVLDGFDELGPAADALLARAEEAADLYAQLRIIATGRPIELRSLNYGKWQILETLPLTREEQLTILKAEAYADGLSGAEATADARARLHSLQDAPDLLRLAETPLVLRLLRPHLLEAMARRTLGDLLYDVLHERLGGWGRREGKEQARAGFAAAMPDSSVRESLLGQIAAAIHASADRTISKHALAALVEEAVRGAPDHARVIAEGIEFFLTTFLEGSDDHLMFPSQPLFQCALAAHIARHVVATGTIGSQSEPESLWREVSFTAAILRRKALGDKAREFLDSYVDLIFAKLGTNATPAAAAIVGEALDSSLAVRTLEHLRLLGYQPLKYFGDRTSASASQYARLFALSGEEGFGWFYAQYLDPRFPHSGLGADLGPEILRFWLLLQNFQPTEQQRNLLQALFAPHMAARSTSCFTVLPAVSLAVWGGLTIQQRARLAADSLSVVPLRNRAESVLRTLVAEGRQAEVLEALEVVLAKLDISSSQGDHPALPLWFAFSDGRMPSPSVVKATIIGGTRGSFTRDVGDLDQLSGRLDVSAVLRYYAIQASSISAGAALILYWRGERSFALLAQGLLQGAAGYPGSEEAELALDSLMETAGERALFWLAGQFPNHDALSGPAPAMWRLLLRALDRLEEPRPDVLRFCLPYLGEYTLPRNPDVRRGFQTLLSEASAYRDSLRDSLGSIDRALRYNAGCVLLTCDPTAEVRAAEVVVSGVANSFDRSEWNRFAMRLALGAPVIQRLQELESSLLTVPRTFALAMLHHNGVRLSSDQKERVVDGLLGEAHWIDTPSPGEPPEAVDLRSILGEPDVAPNLLRKIENETGQRAQRAARALLEHHRDSLAVQQEARAWVLAFRQTRDVLPWWQERELRERLLDSEFATAITHAAGALRHETGEESGAYLFARSFDDPSAWRDIIWALLAARSGSGDAILIERYIIPRALEDLATSKEIGSAARDFLRIASGSDAIRIRAQLTLLAHEFGGLLDDQLEDGISGWQEPNATAALLARMPEIPASFRRSRDASNLTLFAPDHPDSSAPTMEEVRDLTRDLELTEPGALGFLERIVLDVAFSAEELGSLAEHSKLGALAASILAFSQGTSPSPEWMVRSLGVSVAYQRDRRVPEIGALRSIIRASVLEDAVGRQSYLAALEEAVTRDNAPEAGVLPGPEILLGELLDVRGDLSGVQWESFFECIVTRPYVLDLQRTAQTARALADEGLSDREKVVQTLRRAGETLVAANSQRHSSDRAAVMLCGYSLLRLEDSVTPLAERLFLLGLSGLILPSEEESGPCDDFRRGPWLPALDLTEALLPLIERVPQARIQQCLAAGLNSDVPEVRVCCRLLAVLARVPFPQQTRAT